jgi:cytochrome c peroxidase
MIGSLERFGRATLLVGALVGLGVAASIAGARTPRPTSSTPGDDVRHAIANDADSLDAALATLSSSIAADAPRDSMRASLRHARTRFKRMEGVIEFYAPAIAAALNARRQEVDDDDAAPPSSFGPRGFPAIETLLWNGLQRRDADSTRRLIDAMRASARQVQSLSSAIVPTDAQVIELTRLELARVATLGIAGFDVPVTHDAMRECADALDGVRSLYAAASARWPRQRDERRALDHALAAASGYLRSHEDFVSFDRLEYLVSYGEPAARALDALRRAAKTTPIVMPRGLRADVASPYASGAFDARAYAPPSAPMSSPALVALGERLFFDPSLSRTGQRSCASCHDPRLAFADGRRRAVSIDHLGAPVARNTPTLINAALEPVQFADARAATLEDQVIEVLRSPAEMGSSIERASRIVGHDSSYRRQFAGAFNSGDGEVTTPLHVRQALASYVRTLVSLDSRFDRAVRGNTAVLTEDERRGFNLFIGKAGCGTCHFAPLFSGNTPPRYVANDAEVIGTSISPARRAVLDPDSGRARIDHRPEHLRAFKVPSLRNVALTAPYMHNGMFSTLDDVMQFYEIGGGAGAGARVTNQTLPADSLKLSRAERKEVIAFLHTLTDTQGLAMSAARSP